MRAHRFRYSVLAIAVLLPGCAVKATPDAASAPKSARWVRESAVYCSGNRNGAIIFAGRVEPDDSLTFGLSIWSDHNIALYGRAVPHGSGWEYVMPHNDMLPDVRCKVDIVMGPNGAPSLTGDPDANCEGAGGQGMYIGSVKFKKRNYEGPVTNELADLPTFFSDAGKCAGS
jgi:hypothetical protein